MNAEIVSIGTELLLGEIDDTNATYLAQQLKLVGLNLFYRTTVGDNESRITDTLKLALGRADVVITTGGLGPTVDDMTRQAVADTVGQPLVFRQDLWDQVVARFARFGTRITDNNRAQAMLPERATAIENPVGTAPGFIVETEAGTIISLPGVPHEMKYLMERTVLPYLRQRSGSKVIKLRVLRTAGAGESWLGEKIDDLMRLSNPTVGTAAHGGQTDLRITVRADDEPTADKLIAEIEAQIRARVGEYIYGEDKTPIESALIEVLQKTGRRLLLCEAGTGGLVYRRLLAFPGSTEVIGQRIDFESSEALRAALHLEGELKAESILRALEADYPAGDTLPPIGILFVIEPESTVIGVGTKDTIRERRYGYGQNARESIPWLSGWSIGIAWRLLTENIQLNEAKP